MSKAQTLKHLNPLTLNRGENNKGTLKEPLQNPKPSTLKGTLVNPKPRTFKGTSSEESLNAQGTQPDYPRPAISFP